MNLLSRETKTVSAILLTLLFSLACSAQQLRTLEQREKSLLPNVFKNAQRETLLYRLFIPQNYDRNKKYPLVLYLHGGGGSGNDNQKQIDGGNGYLIDLFTSSETQSRYPSFVVAPQSPVQEGWINTDRITPTRQVRLVHELLDDLQRNYSIDGSRVYVSGQSMGGFGTFAIISEYPSTFAAGVPLCGGGDRSKVARLLKTPLWVFHGAKDESVSVESSRTIVAAIKEAGGQVKYTEYADTGHIIWPRVVKETELLSWLFAQRK